MGKVIFGLVRGLIGKAFGKLDFSDRMVLFLIFVCLIGGFLNVRLKDKNKELKAELEFRQSLILGLQKTMGDLNGQYKSMKQKQDSAVAAGEVALNDKKFWSDRVREMQGLIRQQKKQVDSLEVAKVVYKDRCWNCLGREVECKKRSR